MKTKPWEAQIPDGKPKNPWDWKWEWLDQDNLSYIIDKNNPKMLKISLPREGFKEARDWIKKNKIPLVSWQKYEYHKDRKWWYVFRFRNEESAMAFKLKWL